MVFQIEQPNRFIKVRFQDDLSPQVGKKDLVKQGWLLQKPRQEGM